jgi:putative iron-dependent peroxidase
MSTPQSGILDTTCRSHWIGQFRAAPTATEESLCTALRSVRDQGPVTIGFGPDLWHRLGGAELPDHDALRERTGVTGHTMPATQDDLFVWIQGSAADAVMERLLDLRGCLRGTLDLHDETTAFVFLDSRDLSGFEDGTANPEPDEAPAVAFIPEGEPGAGGSHVVVQKWLHDLDGFSQLPVAEQEAIIGRTKADSVELDPHPPASHLDRVVIVDDDGEELELWRRSVPWGGYDRHGLLFIGFAADPSRFEQMLDRMFAVGDGPHDRLLELSTPITGARYFVPALEDLDTLLAAR